MPRTIRVLLLNAVGIAILVVAVVVSDRGGLWTFVFPAVVVGLLVLAFSYRRRRPERNGPHPGERLTWSSEHHEVGVECYALNASDPKRR